MIGARETAKETAGAVRDLVSKDPRIGAEVLIVALFLAFLLVLGYGARGIFSRGVDALEASTKASNEVVVVLRQLGEELNERQEEHDHITKQNERLERILRDKR